MFIFGLAVWFVFHMPIWYYSYMKRIIQVYVSKGPKYYVAEGIDLSFVTQGKTLDELTKNISEAVALYLEGENSSDFDIGPNPSILMNFELPAQIHA